MKKDGIQNTNGELAWIRGRKKKKRWALNVIRLVNGGKSWGSAYSLAASSLYNRK